MIAGMALPTTAELYDSARACHQAGDLREAAQLYRRVVQAETSHTEAWERLGAALHALGDFAGAADAYESALRLRPGSPDLLFARGQALGVLGQTPEAIKHFAEVVRLNTSHGEALSHLGVCLATEGRREEAIEFLRRAIQAQPTMAPAHHNLGVVLAKEGKGEDAVRYLQEALRLKPDYLEAHHNLGNLFQELGRLDEAAAHHRVALSLRFGHLLARPAAWDLRAFERRMHSQNGEDGILYEILRRVGVGPRFCVEFGAEDGHQGNTAYLIREEGWAGLLLEADEASYRRLAERYIERPDVRCVHAAVTAENIEDLLAAHGVPQDLDVLSIDIDGNDYWVWAAVKAWRPRVVVIEYNASYPPPRRWVMAYNPTHRWDGTDYFGASLASLTALGVKKGYRLVGTDSSGVNAFFVRTDCAGQQFTAPAVWLFYSPPRYGPVGGGHPPGRGPFLEI
jgi:tetratricopeptide (TPR) repeat protein